MRAAERDYYEVFGVPSRLLYDRFGYRGRGQAGFAPFARARRRTEAEARDAAGLAAEVRVGFLEALRGLAVALLAVALLA